MRNISSVHSPMPGSCVRRCRSSSSEACASTSISQEPSVLQISQKATNHVPPRKLRRSKCHPKSAEQSSECTQSLLRSHVQIFMVIDSRRGLRVLTQHDPKLNPLVQGFRVRGHSSVDSKGPSLRATCRATLFCSTCPASGFRYDSFATSRILTTQIPVRVSALTLAPQPHHFRV